VATILIAGALPRIAGYLDTNVPPTAHELEVMRAILIAIQLVAIIIAISFFFFFPLNRARSEEIRKKLEKKRLSPENCFPTPSDSSNFPDRLSNRLLGLPDRLDNFSKQLASLPQSPRAEHSTT
jgi:hypothetical protein